MTKIGCVTAAFAIFVAGYALLAAFLGSPNFFITIRSDSMHPSLERGDVVLIKTEPSYNEGDVVAFFVKDGSGIFVHRVTSVSVENYARRRYRTKGDNLDYGDFWVVEEEAVLGRVVFRVPFVGHAALVFSRN